MLLLVHMGMTVWVGVSPMSVGPLTPSTYFLGCGRLSTVRKCQLDYLSRNLLATGPSRRWRGRGVGVVL